MIGVIKSAYTAAHLYVMRRREFDNLKLRAYFRRHYDIEVGLYSYGCFDRWRMPGPLTVGRYCSVARTVRSTNNNHPLDALTTHPALYDSAFGLVDRNHVWDGSLRIEDDVWIGHNVVILPGCRTIGRGAVIGAGAIVTRDVPPYSVMAGNPARKLRERFAPELAARIEATRWWELDISELRRLCAGDLETLRHPTVANLANFEAASRCPDGRA